MPLILQSRRFLNARALRPWRFLFFVISFGLEPGLWVPGLSGCLGFGLPGLRAAWASGCLGFGLPGPWAAWASGCLGFGLPGLWAASALGCLRGNICCLDSIGIYVHFLFIQILKHFHSRKKRSHS
jgi:hypothetical protein